MCKCRQDAQQVAVTLLLEACKEFVRKVDCGRAFSEHSYAQMKEAIEAAKEAGIE